MLYFACDFGNTAISARSLGAKVTGLDITPEPLVFANEEDAIAGVRNICRKKGMLNTPIL